jgi:hypothetical protein
MSTGDFGMLEEAISLALGVLQDIRHDQRGHGSPCGSSPF